MEKLVCCQRWEKILTQEEFEEQKNKLNPLNNYQCFQRQEKVANTRQIYAGATGSFKYI